MTLEPLPVIPGRARPGLADLGPHTFNPDPATLNFANVPTTHHETLLSWCRCPGRGFRTVTKILRGLKSAEQIA